jgi:hypothetical protein
MNLDTRIEHIVALEKAGFPEAEIAKAAFDILYDVAKAKGIADTNTPKYQAAMEFIRASAA